ncbi:hypothetical protein KGQ24_01640 [Patescibacteria group bacterium]|nr:hypothetical protein [Patescibacteria group bacterium]
MKYVILVLAVIFILYSFIYFKALLGAYKKKGIGGLFRMYVAMFTHVFFHLVMPKD